ncbi:hypothetical protein KNP414_06248 [Paenibacillus mucilaginosus KNP414]|uniref:Uncharacterized protein n=1 Tax=Paenibacillus mucilaginosus (strain KNP414) TaxID=1036673 RepID=F8FK89_PAEMK|nr:hypothetical protein KNP414_06248 [Paenibacillus mucilaginosus KNP414]
MNPSAAFLHIEEHFMLLQGNYVSYNKKRNNMLCCAIHIHK